jgi:hypothetical protein
VTTLTFFGGPLDGAVRDVEGRRYLVPVPRRPSLAPGRAPLWPVIDVARYERPNPDLDLAMFVGWEKRP